jgi:hypothetical protein
LSVKSRCYAYRRGDESDGDGSLVLSLGQLRTVAL